MSGHFLTDDSLRNH